MWYAKRKKWENEVRYVLTWGYRKTSVYLTLNRSEWVEIGCRNERNIQQEISSWVVITSLDGHIRKRKTVYWALTSKWKA